MLVHIGMYIFIQHLGLVEMSCFQLYLTTQQARFPQMKVIAKTVSRKYLCNLVQLTVGAYINSDVESPTHTTGV